VSLITTKEKAMAKWSVKQTVEYWAEGIEAETEEEARTIYLKDQDSYYFGVKSEEIYEEEEDEDEEPVQELWVISR
jgi:hypothetical protein